MAVLTRFAKWQPEEVQVLIAKARDDMRNPNIHSMFDLYVFRFDFPSFIPNLAYGPF